MVETIGIEPMTFALQVRRSPAELSPHLFGCISKCLNLKNHVLKICFLIISMPFFQKHHRSKQTQF